MILTRSLSLAITAVSGGLTLSSTLLLLHPGDLRLLTVTAQLTLLLVELGVLWLLRPRPSPVRIPLPPWETAAQELMMNVN